MTIKVGQEAPKFILPDQDDQLRSLKGYKDRWLLIYFYPKDDTPGCTKEACTVRDALPRFEKEGLAVLGISVDSVASHKKFATKYRLTFPLLADEKKDVVKKYGVWGKKKFMGREYMGTLRTSFLIDPDGKVAKVYDKVKPEKHAEEVWQDLQQLKTEQISTG